MENVNGHWLCTTVNVLRDGEGNVVLVKDA
jgi:hypothetical protein